LPFSLAISTVTTQLVTGFTFTDQA
jgi:hypothetical protein